MYEFILKTKTFLRKIVLINIKTSFLIKQILSIFFEKFYEKRSGKKLVGSSPKTVELKFYIFVIT